MTTIAEGLKDVFLAGVGAMALGAEKTQELVESLIAKGEITVEQGKAINSEVLKQAQATAERVGQQAQTAAGEAAGEAQAAASHLTDQAKTAAELAKEQVESAASMARSQAEMAADAAKKAAGEAKKDSADFATALKHDVLEAQMAMMTSEQRAEFAKKAARWPRRTAFCSRGLKRGARLPRLPLGACFHLVPLSLVPLFESSPSVVQSSAHCQAGIGTVRSAFPKSKVASSGSERVVACPRGVAGAGFVNPRGENVQQTTIGRVLSAACTSPFPQWEPLRKT